MSGKTDISPEAVEHLAQKLEQAFREVSGGRLASIEATTLRAQAARIAELEAELSATVAERNRAMKACEQIHNNALQELRSKWLVRDLTRDDFALIEKEG